MNGTVFEIKELAVHDGPGIRTTVFLKGCPLRCLWCHNPEGLTAAPQLMSKSARCRHCGLCRIPCHHPECQPFGRCLHICPEDLLSVSGRTLSAEMLAAELIHSASPLGNSFGGFTFSGGEPIMQSAFLLETAKCLSGYHLCMETSGYAEENIFHSVIDAMDYVIMDIKVADSELHKRLTGVSNALILRNFEILRQSGKPYLIRTPLIPGLTDTEKNLSAIRQLIGDSPWEKLPYNPMAGAKYKLLNMEYPYQKKE